MATNFFEDDRNEEVATKNTSCKVNQEKEP
jgi:hypothetical protein